jgi:hypothetical protein
MRMHRKGLKKENDKGLEVRGGARLGGGRRRTLLFFLRELTGDEATEAGGKDGV